MKNKLIHFNNCNDNPIVYKMWLNKQGAVSNNKNIALAVLKRCLPLFTDYEIELFNKRFMLGLSLAEIAVYYNKNESTISRQISQIKNKLNFYYDICYDVMKEVERGSENE